MMPNGRTAAKQRERDEQRLNNIRKEIPNVKIEVVWGHEIEEQLTKDAFMKKCFDSYLDEGPIRIRDGFFGG